MPRRSKHPESTTLQQIESADRTELTALFQRKTGQQPGPRASLAYLRGNLAWMLQAEQQGEDPARLRKRLIRRLSVALSGTSRQRSVHRPGTRLIREWQGLIYEVTVLERGYAWQGQVYRSLTPIATAITGTKWSGPRFFGLREAAA